MPELVGLVVVVGVAWVAFRLLSQNAAAVGQREHAELLGLRELVDDLKETAWEHRELDSALSTIVIDKIRTFERSQRGRDAGG